MFRGQLFLGARRSTSPSSASSWTSSWTARGSAYRIAAPSLSLLLAPHPLLLAFTHVLLTASTSMPKAALTFPGFMYLTPQGFFFLSLSLSISLSISISLFLSLFSLYIKVPFLSLSLLLALCLSPSPALSSHVLLLARVLACVHKCKQECQHADGGGAPGARGARGLVGAPSGSGALASVGHVAAAHHLRLLPRRPRPPLGALAGRLLPRGAAAGSASETPGLRLQVLQTFQTLQTSEGSHRCRHRAAQGVRAAQGIRAAACGPTEQPVPVVAAAWDCWDVGDIRIAGAIGAAAEAHAPEGEAHTGIRLAGAHDVPQHFATWLAKPGKLV